MADADLETYTAFFYGTLLHPSILRRVIGHDGEDLEICPGLLLEHTRHQVKHADYPGVLPYAQSRALLPADLRPEERTVRGSVVRGLCARDIELLDYFEGNEYTRTPILVHPLASFVSLSSATAALVPETPPPLPPLTALAQPLRAQTYIYVYPHNLAPAPWEYAEFVRTNAWKWVGPDGQYEEVDRRRAVGHQ